MRIGSLKHFNAELISKTDLPSTLTQSFFNCTSLCRNFRIRARSSSDTTMSLFDSSRIFNIGLLCFQIKVPSSILLIDFHDESLMLCNRELIQSKDILFRMLALDSVVSCTVGMNRLQFPFLGDCTLRCFQI